MLVAILLISTNARADDCDITDAAGGTASTWVAEALDRCMADPSCATMHEAPQTDPVKIVVPPREPHGFYLGLDGTAGLVSRLSSYDAAGGGHVLANADAGWHRGIHACNKLDVVAGNESTAVERFAVVWPFFFMAGGLATETDWQVRPKLDAGRLWLRRPYAMNAITASMAVTEWRLDDGGTATVFPVRYTIRTASQDQFHSVYGDWRMSIYEHNDGDTHVAVIPMELEAKYPNGLGTDVNPATPSATLTTLGVANVETTVDGIHWGAAFGGAFAWGTADQICHGCTPIVGKLSAGVPVEGGTLTTAVERSAHMAMDDVITVEDRVSADFKRDSQHHTVRAAAFAALTRTSARDKPQVTGGSSVGLDLKLPEKIVAAFDLAVARSYYAQLDGDVTPTPQLAGLGTMSLERRFNFTPGRANH